MFTTSSSKKDGHPHSGLEKGYGAIGGTPGSLEDSLEDTDANGWGQNWMSRLDDDEMMSSLSIPGTHDSAAYTNAWPFIATQNMTISQQLDAGIRYFDLRCGIRDDIVEMVHGLSFLGLTLSSVLDTMYAWLDSHSQEGIIVQIKEDRKPERSNVHFAQAIAKQISGASERWRTANTTPSLGELRGKIQLFRRYNDPTWVAFGIDVTRWQDNPSSPFTINTRHGVQLTIQDHYSFPDPTSLPSLIAIKGGDVAGLIERASQDPQDGHWYINFTSAYEFNVYYQLPPREIAVGGYHLFKWEPGVNPRLRTYLREHLGRRRFGIVAMDFPELGSDDLLASLIKTNFDRRSKFRRAIVLCFLLLVLLGLGVFGIMKPFPVRQALTLLPRIKRAAT